MAWCMFPLDDDSCFICLAHNFVYANTPVGLWRVHKQKKNCSSLIEINLTVYS